MANKKSRKRNRKSSKKSNVTIVICGIACIGLIVAVSILHNNKSKETNGTSSITPGVTQSPTDEITTTPTPEVTNEAQPTPTLVPSITEEPVVTNIPTITKEEALKLVTDAVGNKEYSINLKNSTLSVEGKEYYAFTISKDGVEIDPEIIVLMENGSLYYYDKAGVISSFTKFPLDNVEVATPEGEEIGKDAAIELVSKLSKSKLGLNKNFKDYIVEVDEWPTTVQGENTYCLNVFDKTDAGQQLVGVYYVSLDGKNIYRLNDETQEFILISE